MSSGKQKLVIGFAIVGIILLIGPSVIFPGSELVPDASRGEFLWGWGSHVYAAKLGAGTWTVTVTQSTHSRLDFDLFVTTGLFLLPYSLGSDESDGAVTSKSVTFILNESAVVHIRVSESSVYHNSAGSYSVLISGDGEPSDSFFPIALNFFAMIFLFIGIGFICCIVSGMKQQRRMTSIRRTIPRMEYFTPARQSQSYGDPDLRTIRLPAKCPTCSADLSDSNIDWTGPMEATCLHCGAVIQAKFERI